MDRHHEPQLRAVEAFPVETRGMGAADRRCGDGSREHAAPREEDAHRFPLLATS